MEANSGPKLGVVVGDDLDAWDGEIEVGEVLDLLPDAHAIVARHDGVRLFAKGEARGEFSGVGGSGDGERIADCECGTGGDENERE